MLYFDKTNNERKIMAHNLETNGNDVAFALRGTPAWHNLANRIFSQDEEVSTQLMLDEAKLSNWDVRLSPATDHIPSDWNDTSDAQFVIRTNPFNSGTDVLATVGSRYKVIQNEDLFSFADNLLDGDTRCSWESAGSLKKGKVVFGSLTVPREMVLDPQGANDTTKLYLIVWTSHDGFDEFEKQAQELFAQSVTDKQFSDLIRTIYPKPELDKNGSIKKWESKVVLIDDLYHNSPTNANIKGTAWGAFNALTERLDYYRTARKGNSESLMASASGFDPVITAEKNKILKMVKALA